MKVTLYHRHYGVHTPIKTCEIDGDFDYYCGNVKHEDYKINEQEIIDKIPKDFLPVKPKQILLMIEDGNCSIGQRELSIFRPWDKYFDCYSISLIKE